VKILIVDDEKNVRKITRMSIDCNKTGVIDIFEAESGIKALEIIRREKPDVAIIDMYMPYMDGPELMGEIEKTGIPMKIVIVSGYDSFGYIKQAFKYRAVNYIMKPINAVELNDTLEKIGKELSTGRYESSTDAGITNRLIQRLLHDSIPDLHVIDSLKRYMSENKGKTIATIRVWIKNTEQAVEGYNGVEDLLMLGITHILGNMRGNALIARGIAIPRQLYVFMSFGCDSDYRTEVRAYCEFAHTELLNRGVDCVFGISSSPAPDPEPINTEKLLNHCSQAFLYGNLIHNSIFFADDPSLQIPFQSEIAVTNFIQTLACAIRLCDIRLVETACDRMFAEISAAKTVSLLFCCRISDDIIRSLQRGSSVPIDMQDDIVEVFLSFDIFKIGKYFKNFIMKHIEALPAGTSLKSSDELVGKITEYLSEHYSENITLSTLSSRFFVSREYICKQFKRALGINLFQYLRVIRIERSYVMLQHTNKTISKIAEECGFSDSSYFIKSFHEHYGFTPVRVQDINKWKMPKHK